MKHIVLFLTTMSLLFSCSQNKEEKAALFAETEVKKILNDASTYESVDTKVDSAFASIYTDYDACVAASEFLELNDKQEIIKEEYYLEKSSIAIWDGVWDAYSKERHRQAKEKLEELGNRLKKVHDDILEKKNLIINRNKEIKDKEFVGWAIYHRFRCANGLGVKSLNDILIITDKDFKELKIRLLMDENDPYSLPNIKKVIDGIIE